jgi:hypothetical protein
MGLIMISFVMVIGLLFMPIAYGIYIEILNNETRTSFFNIFRKHWFNFYSVLIIITLPSLLCILTSFKDIELGIDALINILGIYTFPLVFMYQKGIPIIPLGVKFLSKKIKYTSILIILTLSAFLLKHLFEHNGLPIIENCFFIYTTIGLIINYLFVLFDLFLFIMASIVLKEALSN